MRIARRITLLAALVAGVGCPSSDDTPSPTPPPTVSMIAVGTTHACAALTSGAVRCWGDNSEGQLGTSEHFGQISFAPVVAAGVTAPAKLAGGSVHSCARLAGGGVACWGSGVHGQLGNGTWESSVAPVPAHGVADAIDVGGGEAHTCAVVASGAVRCWGSNSYGELGDPAVATTAPGNRSNVPVTAAGVTGATAVATGSRRSCALLADGSVTCWGRLNGSPAGATYHEPVAITSLANARALTSGGDHDCAVVAGGRVKCWGYDDYGQLGDGAPGAGSAEAVYVTSVDSAIAIAAGFNHSCAVLANGTVACWGRNDRGQLGDGTYLDRPAPITVTGLSGATAVAASSEHTCALVTGGEVRCWGDNGLGQLGLDPVLVQTSAVPVTIHF